MPGPVLGSMCLYYLRECVCTIFISVSVFSAIIIHYYWIWFDSPYNLRGHSAGLADTPALRNDSVLWATFA